MSLDLKKAAAQLGVDPAELLKRGVHYRATLDDPGTGHELVEVV